MEGNGLISGRIQVLPPKYIGQHVALKSSDRPNQEDTSPIFDLGARGQQQHHLLRWLRSLNSELSEEALDERAQNLRLPRAVEAAYLRPLRRQAEYGIPSCDLQLRSYSVRNLEFFADFAIRAAYYLNLPAFGPVPLPRITERWTVPLGHFIHKKSQENFERKTLRRLIQIKDGNEETVGIWLAFLAKHAYYGIGMKANVWSFDKLGVGKHMDAQMDDLKPELDDTLQSFVYKKGIDVEERLLELMNRENSRAGSGGATPMQDKRTSKRMEARPWQHPNVPSEAATRAFRRGL